MSNKSNGKPSVSVVVPVYNAEDFLEPLIECLENQTYEDFEVICVNDGSTDSSLAMLEEVAKRDSRFRAVSRENGGEGAARNTGLSEARGKYVICVDADDLCEPNMIEAMVAPFDTDEEIDVVLCDLDNYFDDIDEYRHAPWAVDKKAIPSNVAFSAKDIPDFYGHVTGYCANKMVKRSLIDGHDLKWQEVRTHGDMAFTQSALGIARKIYFVDQELYHHRKRSDGGSLSDVTQDTLFECLFLALEEIKNNLVRANAWDDFESIFVNYALSQCRWKYYRVSVNARPNVHNALRTTWLRRLGITGYPKEFYSSTNDYRFMWAVLNQKDPEDVKRELESYEPKPAAPKPAQRVNLAKRVAKKLLGR